MLIYLSQVVVLGIAVLIAFALLWLLVAWADRSVHMQMNLSAQLQEVLEVRWDLWLLIAVVVSCVNALAVQLGRLPDLYGFGATPYWGYLAVVGSMYFFMVSQKEAAARFMVKASPDKPMASWAYTWRKWRKGLNEIVARGILQLTLGALGMLLSPLLSGITPTMT